MSDVGNDARGQPGVSERRETRDPASSRRRGEGRRRFGNPAASPSES